MAKPLNDILAALGCPPAVFPAASISDASATGIAVLTGGPTAARVALDVAELTPIVFDYFSAANISNISGSALYELTYTLNGTAYRGFYVLRPRDVTSFVCSEPEPVALLLAPLVNLTELVLPAQNPPAGDFWGLTKIESLSLTGYALTQLDISTLPALISLRLTSSQLNAPPQLSPGSHPVLSNVYLDSCLALLGSAVLDDFINQLVDSTAASNGYLELIGTIAPTEDSLAARTALIARGWTIVTE